MGYDWAKDRPLKNKNTTTTPSCSHIWMGPLHRQNLWTWHFSFVGMAGSVYQNGIYHGRIVLPRNYPAAPPTSISIWTPSGRFVCHQPVCLSASQYHPETWMASHWTLQSLIQSLRLHMLTTAHEIGGISTCSARQRRQHALESQSWQADLGVVTNKNGKRTTIRANHANMIRRGLFPLVPQENEQSPNEDADSLVLQDKNLDDDEEEATEDTDLLDVRLERVLGNDKYHEEEEEEDDSPTTTRVVIRSPSRHFLQTLFRNPIRLALWGFVFLFLILNRR
jgi:ubiquitin-protein ligase